ncbi:Serine/threonine-protein kinase [Rhynchospora pubera]|uniref:Receptor-like serine/threonine-protein kinase n=1 Tax=Rhynchospora pubera TaxID=906938 RepID=A0AAV8H627_9POAL|nr:Serine/threonine-protein kinase [Rhynchospora pubera]
MANFQFISLLLTTFFLFSLCTSRDTITLDAPLTYGDTLLSSGGVFTLGFFTSNNMKYLGIWYTQIIQQTVVWVANRDNPMLDSTGILSFNTNGSILQLQNSSAKVFWSTSPLNRVTTVAHLLDTGNFVLMDNNTSIISWQSFDYPTDTLLPGLKVGLIMGQPRFLTSWTSSDNPSSSNYTIKLDSAGFPEYFILDRSKRVYRTGPWNGRQFSGEPEMETDSKLIFVFVSNPNETYYTFYVNDTSLISRLVLNQSFLQRYVSDGSGWTLYWSLPRDQCDSYAQCGPYGVCNLNSSNVPDCTCLAGFTPESEKQWDLRDTSAGCIRRTGLNCTSDGFIRISDVKLPETTNATVDSKVGLEDCRNRCFKNCSCTGYSNLDVSNGESSCMMWFSDLVDIRQFNGGGQILYYRVAGSDVPAASNASEKRKTTNAAIIVICIILGLVFLASFGYLVQRMKRKKKGLRQSSFELAWSLAHERDGVLYEGSRSQGNLSSLPLYDVNVIFAATNNFSPSNKLGEGGFGTVFMGELDGGNRIAVKRLGNFSTQGLDELKNEVILIAKLQHINLVSLLGCCIKGEELMLIYEYMENKSMDTIIFDKAKSSQLNWKKRFEIIKGIARGVLYLHQDSRLRVIHRDLKASNVLLDKHMNPKISDFGLARIFGTDDTKSHTNRVVGTYGYMSPEYAMDGIFSVKSDVFSFGVLVLEIISGKKNRRIFDTEPSSNLLSYAWTLWKDNKSLELLDTSISKNSFHREEIMRCIQVGLLCVQDRPDDRPEMSTVVLMLNSQDAILPQPKQPGYFSDRVTSDAKSSSSCTVYDTTLTIMEPC